MVGDIAQVIEYLPSKLKALSSNPSIAKKNVCEIINFLHHTMYTTISS
jgi:hypothetical protein